MSFHQKAPGDHDAQVEAALCLGLAGHPCGGGGLYRAGRGVFADGQGGDTVQLHKALVDGDQAIYPGRSGAACHAHIARKFDAYVTAAQGAQMINGGLDIQLAAIKAAVPGHTQFAAKAAGGVQFKPCYAGQGACPFAPAFLKLEAQVDIGQQYALEQVFIFPLVDKNRSLGGRGGQRAAKVHGHGHIARKALVGHGQEGPQRPGGPFPAYLTPQGTLHVGLWQTVLAEDKGYSRFKTRLCAAQCLDAFLVHGQPRHKGCAFNAPGEAQIQRFDGAAGNAELADAKVKIAARAGRIARQTGAGLHRAFGQGGDKFFPGCERKAVQVKAGIQPVLSKSGVGAQPAAGDEAYIKAGQGNAGIAIAQGCARACPEAEVMPGQACFKFLQLHKARLPARIDAGGHTAACFHAGVQRTVERTVGPYLCSERKIALT